MEKIMLVAAALAIPGAQHQTARAGERVCATSGKILTRVAISAVVVSAVNAPTDSSASYYSYNACPPPVVCVPAPVACARRPVVGYRPPVACAPPVVGVCVAYGSPRRHGHHGHR